MCGIDTQLRRSKYTILYNVVLLHITEILMAIKSNFQDNSKIQKHVQRSTPVTYVCF